MKFATSSLVLALVSCSAFAFAPASFGVTRSQPALNANIRGPTEKSKELRFGKFYYIILHDVDDGDL